MRRILASILFSLSLAACNSCGGGSSNQPAAQSPSAGAGGGGQPVQEAAPCQGKTCGACVGEAGCWWCPSKSSCVTDQQKEQGACPDAKMPHEGPECGG